MGSALIIDSTGASRLLAYLALLEVRLAGLFPHISTSSAASPAVVEFVPPQVLTDIAFAWVVILLVAGGMSLGLGIYAWRHYGTAGRLSFSLLMLAVAGWCLAYAGEHLSQSLGVKVVWGMAQYPFITAVPVLWLLFALQYTGHGGWISRRTVIWLAVVPVLSVLLVWSNPAHHWFYRRTYLDILGTWAVLVVEHGPLFWLHATFSYLCLIISTLLLGGALLRTSRIYRHQSAVLLAGSLVPWGGNILYLAGLSPWPALDLTPVTFTLSGMVMAFGLYRYRLLEVVPVARQAILDGLPAAMIVLDADGRIADLNPAARRLFGVTEKEAVGRLAREVLKPSDAALRFADVTQADTEIDWDEGGERRTFRVTITPLADRGAGTAARFLLISDVTAQTRAREALEQANRRLQALQQSTVAMTAIRELAELFEQTMQHVESVVPFRRAALSLWDEATTRLTLVAHRGFDLERTSAGLGVSFRQRAERVARLKTPLLAEDMLPDAERQSGEGEGAYSVLMAPLLYRERCLGVLGVTSAQPAAYSAAEQDLLLAFASQVATALENTRLYEREQARRHLADTLQEAGRTLSTSLLPDRVLDLLMDQLARVVDYQGAVAGLLQGNLLELKATRGGLGSGPRPTLSLDVSDNGIFREMAATGRPVVIADVTQDPRWVPIAGFEYVHAWLGVPLSVGDRLIGQLAVYHAQAGHYGVEDGQALLGLARQAAAAIDNARLYEESERWAARLRVLYEVSTAAATAAGLEETLQRIVQALQQTMQSDGAALLLHEPDTGELVMRAWAGYSGGSVVVRRPVGVGIPGWVAQTGQPALIADTRLDPRYHALDGDARSELCVPLHVGQRVIGALKLRSQRPAAFGEDDLHLLTTLAGHLATIIENAALSEEAKTRADILDKSNRHLTLLHEIARVASSTLELSDLYQALADTLAQIIGGDGCYITRLDETTGEVVGGAAYGPYRDAYKMLRPPPGELTLTESVLKAGRPLAVEDVFHSPYMSPRVVETFPARSQLGLPLRIGPRNLGAVLIAFNQPHTFTEEEISWAIQAADLTALALENARLYEEAKTWAAELEQRVAARTRELQAAQAQLLHAERLAALGRLSAGVAHEIGNPLSIIRGYVELLAEEQPDQRFIHIIRNSVEQLLALLAQLRDFSKPAVEFRSAVQANDVVDRVLALAEHEMVRRRVKAHPELAGGLPPLPADARQLEQVVLNLVLNACDAMPEGGKLTVRTFCELNRVVVEVADTGMGIPAENLAQIFEPYFSTKEDKGTGLGLAICRRLVEAHGGQIVAESQVGVGTTFRFWLPLGAGPGE